MDNATHKILTDEMKLLKMSGSVIYVYNRALNKLFGVLGEGALIRFSENWIFLGDNGFGFETVSGFNKAEDCMIVTEQLSGQISKPYGFMFTNPKDEMISIDFIDPYKLQRIDYHAASALQVSMNQPSMIWTDIHTSQEVQEVMAYKTGDGAKMVRFDKYKFTLSPGMIGALKSDKVDLAIHDDLGSNTFVTDIIVNKKGHNRVHTLSRWLKL